jgi:hypothetical protein
MVRSSAIDTERLWELVSHGSPMEQAMALVLLDRLLEGKISKLAKEFLDNMSN